MQTKVKHTRRRSHTHTHVRAHTHTHTNTHLTMATARGIVQWSVVIHALNVNISPSCQQKASYGLMSSVTRLMQCGPSYTHTKNASLKVKFDKSVTHRQSNYHIISVLPIIAMYDDTVHAFTYL